MKTTLIKNGFIVTENETLSADLIIRDGIIDQIGNNLTQECDLVIDASDQYIIPGGIDVHTHMELPVMGTHSSDDFETGAIAALHGGTTTIIDFANQTKGSSLFQAYRTWREKADNKVKCNYGLHVSVTDVTKESLEEIDQLMQYEGVTSFKTFLAYDNMKLPLDQLETLMRKVKDLGGLITVHAEIGETISQKSDELRRDKNLSPNFHPMAHPESAELEATKTMIELSKKTNCPVYFVHISSASALELIAKERIMHKILYTESCPQYLFLNDQEYLKDNQHAVKYVMSPPLRSVENQKSLWYQVAQKRIDVIATDHCPFTLQQKLKNQNDFTKIPNGAPGVEDRVLLLFSEGFMGRSIELIHFVKMISTNPAKLFGLYPQKGTIKIGSDADLVIIDPNFIHTISSTTHHMNVDYNCYQDKKLQGQISKVLLNGEIVISHGRYQDHKNKGRYLKRNKPILEL